MHEGGVDRAAAIVGLFVGLLTAGGLYLWQGTTQVAVAGFVIFGHISWMWMATRAEALAARQLYGTALNLPGNCMSRRIGRMLRDPNYWWSLLFGGVMVVGSVRYAGMEETIVLGLVGLGWVVIALYMNFGLTIVHPTTKCRRCKYDLIAHLAVAGARTRITCPECGARWRRGDLCPQHSLADERAAHHGPAQT